MPLVVYVGSAAGFEAARATVGDIAIVVHAPAEPDGLAEVLADADALLDASMKVPITDAMVDAAPKLRVVSTATTGADHISRGALDRRGIPLHTLREDPEVIRNITPAAEHTWALLMACARRLPAAVGHVHAGRWVREDFPGMMLKDRQIGLIGCGRLGQWMARYATAFGMAVVGVDPHLDDWPETITETSMATLLETSDVISVHVHLTAETRGLLSADLLATAKPGVIILNTSRGAIIDEAALLQGLKDGRIGAAGLDVLDGEPDIADHPLVVYARDHDNLLITPHIGGFSPDAVRLVCTHAAGKIVAALTPIATDEPAG